MAQMRRQRLGETQSLAQVHSPSGRRVQLPCVNKAPSSAPGTPLAVLLKVLVKSWGPLLGENTASRLWIVAPTPSPQVPRNTGVPASPCFKTGSSWT